MGNNCSINGKLVKNCWYGTISHTLWWPKWPNMLSYNNKKETKEIETPAVKAIESSDPVQTKPPQPVKMEEKNATDSSQPPAVEPVAMAKPEVEPPQAINKDEKESVPIPRPEQVIIANNECPKPVEAPKQNRPQVFNRKLSVGLKVDSVLRTKTGHLNEDFNLGRKLGHGQFGTTFLCTEKKTGKEYACKSIARRKLLTQEDVDDVRREVEILHHLSGNPSVVSIKGAYEDAVAVHVIMELCAGGELFDRIVKRGHYSEKKAAELTRTIVGVIETCHSLGVMHRDLKPENFLFVNEEEDSSLKTIDFGLSMFFKPGGILQPLS